MAEIAVHPGNHDFGGRLRCGHGVVVGDVARGQPRFGGRELTDARDQDDADGDKEESQQQAVASLRTGGLGVGDAHGCLLVFGSSGYPRLKLVILVHRVLGSRGAGGCKLALVKLQVQPNDPAGRIVRERAALVIFRSEGESVGDVVGDDFDGVAAADHAFERAGVRVEVIIDVAVGVERRANAERIAFLLQPVRHRLEGSAVAIADRQTP